MICQLRRGEPSLVVDARIRDAHHHLARVEVLEREVLEASQRPFLDFWMR